MEQGNTDGPPLGAFVDDVNIGDREVRARPVGSSAEVASDNHALDSARRFFLLAVDEKRHTRVAGPEVVLVEEHSVVVLGDNAEIVLQRCVVTKARTFLHADNMPRAIKMACQQTWVQTPEGVRDSRKQAVACLTVCCSSDHDAKPHRQGDEMAAGNALVAAPVLDGSGQATFPACSPGSLVAHAMHRTSRCHLRDNTRRRLPRGAASGSQLPESQQKSCQRLGQKVIGCLAAS